MTRSPFGMTMMVFGVVASGTKRANMPNINDVGRAARRILPIIFVIDISQDHIGDNIHSVNSAMHALTDELKKIANHNSSYEPRIGIMLHAFGCIWLTGDCLISTDEFEWKDLSCVVGKSDILRPLNELDCYLNSRHLSSDRLSRGNPPITSPLIFIMNGSKPEFDDNYTYERYQSRLYAGLDSLRGNKWFKSATVIGVFVDDGADLDALAAITGNPETVISISELAEMGVQRLMPRITGAEMSFGDSRVTGSNIRVTSGTDVAANKAFNHFEPPNDSHGNPWDEGADNVWGGDWA